MSIILYIKRFFGMKLCIIYIFHFLLNRNRQKMKIPILYSRLLFAMEEAIYFQKQTLLINSPIYCAIARELFEKPGFLCLSARNMWG